ncbi:hypothetical protein BKA63DRAFT_284830 [Paraphoma chrysanthemicola]|nr:hypothetical protein BKA63DRAFT_284830 [Paraphoma chrysanthemicola]
MPEFPMLLVSESEEANWPLLGRGWVCQERRLSTRVIHYAKDQILWECNSTFRSTSDLDSPVHKPNAIRDVPNHEYLNWTRFIRLYSGMKFTKSGDRLPALAGIVEREGRQRKDDIYVAGTWKSTLLQELGFVGAINSSVVPGIPTWSWAYIRDSVWFWPIMHGTSTTTLTGLDFISDGASNMGKVISASIRLKGPTLAVRADIFSSYQSKVPILDNGIDELLIQDKPFRIHEKIDPKAELVLILMSASTDVSVSNQLGINYGQCRLLILKEKLETKYERLSPLSLRYRRTDIQHSSPSINDPKLVAQNMERLLALFTVREVEII